MFREQNVIHVLNCTKPKCFGMNKTEHYERSGKNTFTI